jgi:septum formation protein
VPVLVLASASPRRRALLERLGLTPLVRPTDVDETPGPGESPTTLVLRLARAKAAAAAEATTAATSTTDEVVLAADTEVVLDGCTLGKPTDPDDASAMLAMLSGRTHEVVTGVVVRRGSTVRETCVTTTVGFRTLSRDDVAWYVATGEPLGKAGAYALQGAGAVLVDRIEGSDTNVIGLPLPATVALLRAVGLDPLTTSSAAVVDPPLERQHVPGT